MTLHDAVSSLGQIKVFLRALSRLEEVIDTAVVVEGNQFELDREIERQRKKIEELQAAREAEVEATRIAAQAAAEKEHADILAETEKRLNDMVAAQQAKLEQITLKVQAFERKKEEDEIAARLQTEELTDEHRRAEAQLTAIQTELAQTLIDVGDTKVRLAEETQTMQAERDAVEKQLAKAQKMVASLRKQLPNLFSDTTE